MLIAGGRGTETTVLLGGRIRLAKNAHNNIVVLCWAIVVLCCAIIVLCWAIIVDIVGQLLSFFVVFIINIIVLER